MLTIVALEAEATDIRQAPAVAAALAVLARRQEVAVVSDCRAFQPPYRLASELRAALPMLRLIDGSASMAHCQHQIDRIGALLQGGALPLVLAAPGCTASVTAMLADKLAANAVLRMTEPGLVGAGDGARLSRGGGRRPR